MNPQTFANLDKPFLQERVKDIRERYYMCYFYIGDDKQTMAGLGNSFELGYHSSGFGEALEYLQHLYSIDSRLPDAIFIDLSFSEHELSLFCAGLKSNCLLSNIAIIYNEQRLSDFEIVRLTSSRLVDDIVAINSSTINFLTKILFIKQSKLYNQLQVAHKNEFFSTRMARIFFRRVGKRGMDIFIASAGIVLLSPVLLLIALAIRIESRGPIFYTALRAGRGFRVFRFYKFRSMVKNADKDIEKLSALNQYKGAEASPVFFKFSNDPRITKLGRWLRNTSIDELPQLFNVLKGDMSVVGNRPLPLYEAESLTTNESVERFSGPAGITGLWQVSKRGKADMSAEERIRLDITYARKCTLRYDLMILAKTPLALFQKSDV